MTDISSSDYARARAKGIVKRLIGTVILRPNRLISLVEVKNGRVYRGQIYRGTQTIPLSRIIGSVNRALDFDRDFNPLSGSTADRWESVNRAYLNDVPLPPIELQKVVDNYFIIDGHHRVSVARYHKAEYIDAIVIDSICAEAAA